MQICHSNLLNLTTESRLRGHRCLRRDLPNPFHFVIVSLLHPRFTPIFGATFYYDMYNFITHMQPVLCVTGRIAIPSFLPAVSLLTRLKRMGL